MNKVVDGGAGAGDGGRSRLAAKSQAPELQRYLKIRKM